MKDCIFCKIANKEIPAKVIFEDDICMAYLDINPLHSGHTLIIPKNHFTDLDDINEETVAHIIMIAKKIKKLLEEKIGAKGIKLVQNNGTLQEVKHYHMHVIPDCKVKDIPLDEVYKLLTK
ncbi:MAG: HIT domain-containing protein [Bacilli bacterium]|nr:HIT domain-containing protein [Bacilli bacterium]